ncbi:MAG: asparaginase, partial [Alphaproteobacteria bacterium]|nr:asparaginase [Alphaproteobacteria bacterium]
DHPVQRAVRDALCRCCGVEETSLQSGIDGCCAPNYALPIQALARGMAALAVPSTLPPAMDAAARRLHGAVRAHPLLGSGHGRADALMIGKAAFAATTKAGAEGIHCAIIPGLGMGVAVKIDDGAGRAAETVIASVLAALGVLDANDPDIAALVKAPLFNTGGDMVGERRVAPAITDTFRRLR